MEERKSKYLNLNDFLNNLGLELRGFVTSGLDNLKRSNGGHAYPREKGIRKDGSI